MERPARPAFKNGNKLGLGKWIQILLGAFVCLVVFLGPLIQPGNVQNSSMGPLPGAMGQAGHLFLSGESVILVAKSKDDLLALRETSGAPNQSAQKSLKTRRKAGSNRSTNKVAPVPAGATIRVLDVSGGLCRVIVLDGEFEGTLGWVDTARISSLSRQEGQ
ncbi:MAG: hypothetical protein LAO31_01970 [Acidobacteriia bacterium]|nr:hypothetical protein [Terriglobia bacterium]